MKYKKLIVYALVAHHEETVRILMKLYGFLSVVWCGLTFSGPASSVSSPRTAPCWPACWLQSTRSEKKWLFKVHVNGSERVYEVNIPRKTRKLTYENVENVRKIPPTSVLRWCRATVSWRKKVTFRRFYVVFRLQTTQRVIILMSE